MINSLPRQGCMRNRKGDFFMESGMFCYQCQETAGCKGCTRVGVCGKTAETAGLQDLLIYVTKGLADAAHRLREEGGAVSREVNRMVTQNLFATITNANFDSSSIAARIESSLKRKDDLLTMLKDKKGLSDASTWTGTREDFEGKARKVGVLAEKDEDIRSLKELITYGLKGLSAYLYHANALGKEKDEIDAFQQAALAKLLDPAADAESLTALALETGKWGVETMALLDAANTEAYGSPEITKVDLGVRKNPGILISGHDLHDLEMLLEQSEGTGVDIYTHGEMLAAHYYPKFKKYSHFAGNYGNAWWRQKEEFEAFHGPILMTTNCIVPPMASYQDRLFTTGVTAFPSCPHIEEENGRKDFSPLIAMARNCPPPEELEQGEILGGFAHSQVLALADKVAAAVKSGAIRKFVVMAGCDGRMKSRSYYEEFAQALPRDTIILTAGCAKYKYIKLDLGTIDGIPRVLDAGQCNDSYSLALIALKLKEVFGLSDINELPIVYNISWYEQKAVIVLLALLHLGVKNIHLGPTLPAFLSPNIARVLVRDFGIGSITTAADDIRTMIG